MLSYLQVLPICESKIITVALVSIFLFANGDEHFYMLIGHLCFSDLCEMSVHAFCFLFIRLLISLLRENSLMYLDNNAL